MSDVEEDADNVIHHDEDLINSILERDQVFRFSEFRNMVEEQVREQLGLLEQYARSGNFNIGRYDLREEAQKCILPLIEFRVQVHGHISQHSKQNNGQKYVSTNCINPTNRKRVRGAQFGLTKYSDANF